MRCSLLVAVVPCCRLPIPVKWIGRSERILKSLSWRLFGFARLTGFIRWAPSLVTRATIDTRIDVSRDSDSDRLVYAVAEAGVLLGISRAFAHELVARGELPVIRLGRRRLVPKVALLALVGAQPAGDQDANEH